MKPKEENGCHVQNEEVGVIAEAKRDSMHQDPVSSPISMHR